MKVVANVLASALLLPALMPFTALAQSSSPKQLDALLECRQLSNGAARLTCFDRTAAELAAARDAGNVAVVDSKLLRARGQREFGLAPRRERREQDEQLATPVEIKATIRSVRANAASPGRWDFGLDNGMVWQSVEPLWRVPRAGEAVVIRRVRLGGYRASFGSGPRTALLKRLR